MKYLSKIIAFLTLSILFTACETEIIPETTFDEEEIVVEGYIEAGTRSTPPIVILTRSQPFYSEFSTEQLDGLFVHDALVTVRSGSWFAQLEEICFNELTDQQQVLFLNLLGIDSLSVNFCVYTDPTLSVLGSRGRRYDLRVEVDDKVITATTRIPELVALDSVWFEPVPGNLGFNYREMHVILNDPEGEPNYYRYFTDVDNQGYIPGFNSVLEDRFFDGQTFEFPLAKGEPRNYDDDPDLFGLYKIGNTVSLRWCAIDESQYVFWNTLEFNTVNQGPFSSYTRVQSNINGGLGIWGGYSAIYYDMEVK